MLRTGPFTFVMVLWHIQSVVSHSAMTLSSPPLARYRAVGWMSIEMHDDVWPLSENSAASPPSSSWCRRRGSRLGYDKMRTRPSAVARNTFSPPQQNTIWLMQPGCWWLDSGDGCDGERIKMVPACGQ